MRRPSRLRLWALCLWVVTSAIGCAGDPPDAGGCEVPGRCAPLEVPGPAPRLGETRQVVPATPWPDGAYVGAAVNNLDIVDHEGRLWLAYRTAPTHFAGADVQLVVVSTEDERTWRHELTLQQDTDLREPRLLSWQGRLFLYYAVLGRRENAFEPERAEVVVRDSAGTWSSPAPAFGPRFIPWRARVMAGRPHLVGYSEGQRVYDLSGGSMPVEIYTSDTGLDWDPVRAQGPVVLEGGVSELDFAYLPDGSVVAVGRNEAGDEDGFGSKICRGEPADPWSWRCATDPRKYDSPLVFARGARVYLIGRRHLTESGHYDVGRPEAPWLQRFLANQYAYWNARKRCALWEVDAEALTVHFLLDLPSQGDTCFASIVERGPSLTVVYNYSSPLEGDDPIWRDGQRGETRLYRSEILWD